MTSDIGARFFMVLWTGASLLFLATVIWSWFKGRIRVKGVGWVVRRDNPVTFHFHVILFTLMGTAFSLFGLYVLFHGPDSPGL